MATPQLQQARLGNDSGRMALVAPGNVATAPVEVVADGAEEAAAPVAAAVAPVAMETVAADAGGIETLTEASQIGPAPEDSEPPGKFASGDVTKARCGIVRGSSGPTIELNRESELKRVQSLGAQIVEIPGHMAANPNVDEALINMAKKHILNSTDKIDCDDFHADDVYVDTLLLAALIGHYHSLACKEVEAGVEVGEDGDEEEVGVEVPTRKLKSTIVKYMRDAIINLLTAHGFMAETELVDGTVVKKTPGMVPGDIQLIGGFRMLGAPYKKSDDVELDAYRVEMELKLDARLKAEVAAQKAGRNRLDAILVQNQIFAQEEGKGHGQQVLKLATPEVDGDRLLRLVRSGAFKDIGFYPTELDTSLDGVGTVRKREAAEALVASGKARYQKDFKWSKGTPKANARTMAAALVPEVMAKLNREAAGGVILDNAAYVSDTCLTVMHTSDDLCGPTQDELEHLARTVYNCDTPAKVAAKVASLRRELEKLTLAEKLKFYAKEISNWEHKCNRQHEPGSHASTTGTDVYGRVPRLVTALRTQRGGAIRFENTQFLDQRIPLNRRHLYTHPNSASALEALRKTVALVPKELVYNVSLERKFELICKAVAHTLVVVHSRYDRALVVYTHNFITGNTCGLPYADWSRKCGKVLDQCMFGSCAVDVLSVHTGQDVPLKRVKELPAKRKSRAMSPSLIRDRKEAREKAKRQKSGQRQIGAFFSASGGQAGSSGDGEVAAAAAVEEAEETEEAEAPTAEEEAAAAAAGAAAEAAAAAEEAEAERVAAAAEAAEAAAAGPMSVHTVSTAAASDQKRNDYTAGFIAPRDTKGALVVSQRLCRAPTLPEQLGGDGGFLPITRLLTHSANSCFKPSGNNALVYDGETAATKSATPEGYNEDFTCVADVGPRPNAVRLSDREMAPIRLAQGGMGPNGLCHIETFGDAKVLQIKPRLYSLIACKTSLPVCPLALLKKAFVKEELGKEKPEAKFARMRASLETYPDERDATLLEQMHFLNSHSYKCNVLHPSFGVGHAGFPFDEIPRLDALPIVAIQMLGVTSNTVVKQLVVFLLVPGPDATSIVKPFTLNKHYNMAFRWWNPEMAPLWNEKGFDGKMSCWMSPKVDGVTHFPIGSLDRPIMRFLDSHGRPAPKLSIRLQVPEGTGSKELVITDMGDATRTCPAAAAADGPMVAAADVEMADVPAAGAVDTAGEGLLPNIERPSPCPRQSFMLLHTVLKPHFAKAVCMAFEVQKMGTTIEVGGKHMVPLQIRITSPTTISEQARVHTALGGEEVLAVRDKINSTSFTFFVSNATAKKVELELVENPEVDMWWRAAMATREGYVALPDIKKQMPSPLPSYHVTAAKRVFNQRRQLLVFILRMDDGLVYKFASPQSATAFCAVLQESNALNLTLNTDAWTMVAA